MVRHITVRDISNEPDMTTMRENMVISEKAAHESDVAIMNAVGQKANSADLSAVSWTGNYSDLTGKPTIPTLPTLSTVATTGSYNDLSNKPTIPTLPSLATVATSGSYNDLSNKPTIPTVKRTETFLGTTNASGNFSVTYSTPYLVAPDVQPQLQAGTPSQVVRITSSTTTGFTVQATNRASVNLLSIEVLLAATTPVSGASVSVLVTQR